MRRYQKWLSMGLLALTPGVTLAGPLNSPLLKQSTSANPSLASKTADKSKGASNQELANKIAAALKKAKLNGFEIEISVQNGVAQLDGMVGSAAQREAAAKAALIPGVTKVNNRLGVGDTSARGQVQQAAMQRPAAPMPPQMAAMPQQAAAMPQQMAAAPRAAARPQAIRTANFQAGYEGQEPVQQPVAPQPMGPMNGPPSGIPGYAPPAGYGPGAGYAPAAGGATHVVYNQPNFPNYSWPTYAQYPNYAGVTYPSQYSASAWPYIGPFYPYPQVPLGWRKAQLEWDDGYWNLNFRARTDKWWWFLNPQNW
jgi:hypothetical protein